jgi:hypothetical protein
VSPAELAAMAAALCSLHAPIRSEARRAGVAPETLGAIVWLESRGNPGVVYVERDGSCSAGLGQVKGSCDPARLASLRSVSTGLRASSGVLRATRRWCRAHPSDRYCRAGERAFRGGGAVNRYAGASTRYAVRVGETRRAVRAAWMRCSR